MEMSSDYIASEPRCLLRARTIPATHGWLWHTGLIASASGVTTVGLIVDYSHADMQLPSPPIDPEIGITSEDGLAWGLRRGSETSGRGVALVSRCDVLPWKQIRQATLHISIPSLGAHYSESIAVDW